MRISSINVAQPRYVNYNSNYNSKNKNVQNPSFKQYTSVATTLVGGFIGFIGTAAVIGTAGLAAPLVVGALGAATGAIGGDMIDKKGKPSTDAYGQPL